MRNIVLVTSDALRADHCSFMGYERGTTPNLDKIAQAGVYFENAVAPGPRTIPSMPAIFTGKLMHSVNSDQFEELRKNVRAHLISNETIAEKLSRKGYTTGAFCPQAYTSSYFGFDKGFDYYQDFLWSSSSSHQRIFEKMKSGNKLFGYLRNVRNMILKQEAFKSWESYYEDIINWADQAKKPFFLWVFLLDTHLPWIIPGKYRKWGNFFNMYYSGWKIFRLLDEQNVYIPEKIRGKLINAYDDSIYYADQFIGKLQEDLKAYDPIFVFHSDHGEEFGERGFYGHNYPHLYEENIHVPLVIGNSGEAREIGEPVSLLTLPTIILNLSTSDSGSDSSLTVNDEWAISRDFDHMNNTYVTALRVKDWKFITGQKGKDELFNLREDPSEQENVIDEHPKLANELREIVNRYISKRGEKANIQERAARLRGA